MSILQKLPEKEMILQKNFQMVVLSNEQETLLHFNPADLLILGVQCGSSLTELPIEFTEKIRGAIPQHKYAAINPGCTNNFYEVRAAANANDDFKAFKKSFFIWYFAKYFHSNTNPAELISYLNTSQNTGVIHWKPQRNWRQWVTKLHEELIVATKIAVNGDASLKSQAMVPVLERRQALLEIGWYWAVVPTFENEIIKYPN